MKKLFAWTFILILSLLTLVAESVYLYNSPGEYVSMGSMILATTFFFSIFFVFLVCEVKEIFKGNT